MIGAAQKSNGIQPTSNIKEVHGSLICHFEKNRETIYWDFKSLKTRNCEQPKFYKVEPKDKHSAILELLNVNWHILFKNLYQNYIEPLVTGQGLPECNQSVNLKSIQKILLDHSILLFDYSFSIYEKITYMQKNLLNDFTILKAYSDEDKDECFEYFLSQLMPELNHLFYLASYAEILVTSDTKSLRGKMSSPNFFASFASTLHCIIQLDTYPVFGFIDDDHESYNVPNITNLDLDQPKKHIIAFAGNIGDVDMHTCFGHASFIYTLFFLTLTELHGQRSLKRCQNCGKYFITNSNSEKYCDNYSPQSKAFTCKEYRLKNCYALAIHNDPTLARANTLYMRIQTRANRNPDIYKGTYETFRFELKEMKKKYKKGIITAASFNEWLASLEKSNYLFQK